MEKCQNAGGTTLRCLRSETSHCSRKRAVQHAWPIRPIVSQSKSVGMVTAGTCALPGLQSRRLGPGPAEATARLPDPAQDRDKSRTSQKQPVAVGSIAYFLPPARYCVKTR